MPPSQKPQPASESKKTIADAETTLDECDALLSELEVLRVAYERYFLGQERMPPAAAHDTFKRRLATLRNGFVRQTAVKFRVQMLQSKYLTYERLWTRTLQEIESGTYRRDVYKAQRRAKKKDSVPTDETPPETRTVSSVTIPGIPAASQPPSPPVPAGNDASLSESKLRAVYDAYVRAKRTCNEDVSKLSYESLASTLRKQAPGLLKQHNAQSLDFKVVIKDGKAVLRAVPK
jgi:hypothetical protein